MTFAFNAGDQSTPREVFNRKLSLVIVVATCGSIIFGYDLAFIGGVFSLPSFITRFDLTSQNSSALQAHMVNTCTSIVTLSLSQMAKSISSPGRGILRCHGGILRKRKIRSQIRTSMGIGHFQHRRGTIHGIPG